MKSIKIALFFLVSSLFLVGCFEMEEEVYHKKDGSGTYKFTMDMSGMKSMLSMAMAFDTTGSMNMDTFKMISKEFYNKVDGMSGLTNIREVSDMENFVFGVEFDYKDLSSLNAAASQLFEAPGDLSSGEEKLFESSKRKFKRLPGQSFNSLVDEMMGEMGGGENMDMAMMFFKDVSYTTIYHFDKKVKKVSNDMADISNDGKTVTLKYYLFDEDRGGKDGSLANTIKLKGWWFF